MHEVYEPYDFNFYNNNNLSMAAVFSDIEKAYPGLCLQKRILCATYKFLRC